VWDLTASFVKMFDQCLLTNAEAALMRAAEKHSEPHGACPSFTAGPHHPKMVLFSGHDSTITPLLAGE
jgi:hypothetical protein